MLWKTLNMSVTYILIVCLRIQFSPLSAQNLSSGIIEYSFTHRVAPQREELSQKAQKKRDSVEIAMEGRLKARGKRMITTRSPLLTKYLVAFNNLETWAYWYDNGVLINSYDCYQNLNNKILRSSERTLTVRYLVSDTMSGISWKMLNESKKIQNIECFSAVAEYRGRVWTVWYAPSIPVSSGPWKLYGLPGMILEAEDKDGLMRFECAKIQIPKSKDLELSIIAPLLNDKEKNITYKEYVVKLQKSIDNYEKMKASKDGPTGGMTIGSMEIFDFEKDIISKRIQQKLSDIKK